MESAKENTCIDNAWDADEEPARVSTKERMVRGQASGCTKSFGTSDGEAQQDDGCAGLNRCDEDEDAGCRGLCEDAGEDDDDDDEFEGMSSRELGRRGEEAACELLKRRGYTIVERNWSCFAGEADIIARDEDGTLVFVEVKTRSNVEFGLPSDAITPQKRARYERIAGCFLSDYDGEECRVRFDVISILALPNKRALVRHYVNAFGSGR